MKIVHISSLAAGGGAGIAALRLHQSMMQQSGINSTLIQRFPIDEEFAKKNNIITANTGDSLFIRARKRFNLHTEHFHWVNLNRYPNNYEIATFATTSYRLEELPIIKEADIIHLHWVAEFLNYPTFFKNIKQPIVWTLHDMNPFIGLFHYENDIQRNPCYKLLDIKTTKIKQRAIRKKDNMHIVCLSEWMKNKSQTSDTFSRYTHHLIPNGLDLSSFSFLNKEKARKELNVNTPLKTILFIASSVSNYRKGFDLIVNTLERLDRTDYNLISVGGNKITTNNKINHIHFERIDETSILNKLYSAADITIIPSREDNLPNTMLESFACGTPVMSFSNGGMAEHVKTGENGILIKEIGSESLAQGLNDFLDNKYIFDNGEIRRYAETTFSDKLQVERYVQLYKEILVK